MSTSLLYHAFGIVGYIYQSTRYIAGNIIVAIQEDRRKLRCPVCRRREVIVEESKLGVFRRSQSGGKRCISTCQCNG